MGTAGWERVDVVQCQPAGVFACACGENEWSLFLDELVWFGHPCWLGMLCFLSS